MNFFNPEQFVSKKLKNKYEDLLKNMKPIKIKTLNK